MMPVQPEVAKAIMAEYPVGSRVEGSCDGEPLFGVVKEHVQGGNGPIVIRNDKYVPRVNALRVLWDDEELGEDQEEDIAFAAIDSKSAGIKPAK
jgi:hypothetical protein